MKTYIKVVVLCIAILASMMPIVANAAGGVSSDKFNGTLCFKLDNWPDTWHWDVTHHGQKSYQIVGFDENFSESSMVGGGVISNNHFYGTITHTHSMYWRALLSVDIDLTTMKGKATYGWYGPDNVVLVYFIDEPFTQVKCSSK